MDIVGSPLNKAAPIQALSTNATSLCWQAFRLPVKTRCTATSPHKRKLGTCRSMWFDDDSYAAPPRLVDVAIVGGGPGGLAAANALLRVDSQMHVEVFERLPHVPMGSGILLNINGQAALEAIHPELQYRMLEKSVVLTKTCFYDAKTGEMIDEHSDRQGELRSKWGKAPRLIGWHEIRETLLEALPPGTVHFSTPVLSHAEDEEGVLVEFLEDITPVKARLLVGADGFFSYTRFQTLRDGPPMFQGRVFWRARVPWRTGLPKDHTAWFVEGDRQNTRFAAIIPVSAKEVVWQASAPVSSLRERGLDLELQAPPAASAQADKSFQADPKQRCMMVFEDFARAFIDVVDLTDGALITEQPLYGRPVESLRDASWGHGRVTLLGDAAHPAPPNGQGCNLAFEDALELGHAVQQHGLTAKALRHYEERRIPRVRDVLQHGTDFAAAAERERVIYAAAFQPLQPKTSSISAQ